MYTPGITAYLNLYIRRKEEKDGRNFLEVDTDLAAKKPDIYNMVASNQPTAVPPMAAALGNKQFSSRTPAAVQCDRDTDSDFVDDPDVPPLI